LRIRERFFILRKAAASWDYNSYQEMYSLQAVISIGNNEIINIGTGRLTSVNDLFRELMRITGYKKKPVYKPARAGELMKSFLDNRKAAKVLGWKPSVTLEKGLEETVAYFLDSAVSYCITAKGR
jgi:nucleoside-diphosphate-sugar epimerase